MPDSQCRLDPLSMRARCRVRCAVLRSLWLAVSWVAPRAESPSWSVLSSDSRPSHSAHRCYGKRHCVFQRVSLLSALSYSPHCPELSTLSHATCSLVDPSPYRIGLFAGELLLSKWQPHLSSSDRAAILSAIRRTHTRGPRHGTLLGAAQCGMCAGVRACVCAYDAQALAPMRALPNGPLA